MFLPSIYPANHNDIAYICALLLSLSKSIICPQVKLPKLTA
jgi:hypothetical protein